MRRALPVLVVLLAWWGGAWAQQLDIVTLKYRTAEQVLPLLRPLLESGGALTGTGDKLFIRASERNRAELKQMLAALDQAPRRLTISVRQGAALAQDERGAEVSGELALGRNARVVVPGSGGGPSDAGLRARVYDTRRSGGDNFVQQVQTIEGGRATIVIGQSVPVPLRQVMVTPQGAIVSDTVAYRDIGSGFVAEPRLSGNVVTLEISPTRDTPGVLPGSANIQRLSTTVSGRLGEWIALGGSVQDSSGDRAGTLRYGTRGGHDVRQVWLKVDELP